jgi:hypothetical protein
MWQERESPIPIKVDSNLEGSRRHQKKKKKNTPQGKDATAGIVVKKRKGVLNDSLMTVLLSRKMGKINGVKIQRNCIKNVLGRKCVV